MENDSREGRLSCDASCHSLKQLFPQQTKLSRSITSVWTDWQITESTVEAGVQSRFTETPTHNPKP